MINLATLNIAHGRGLSLYQGFQKPARIQANLERIARFIVQHKIDLVALQEVDEDSHWNQRINLLQRLQQLTGYEFSCMGVNNRRGGLRPLSYGNAILSRYPILFHQNQPFGEATLGEKGFLYTEIDVKGHRMPLVNLHLDFRSRKARLGQIEHLLNYLTERGHWAGKDDIPEPVICGDFNSRSTREKDAVRHLFREIAARSDYDLLPTSGMTFPSYFPSRGLDFVFLPSVYHNAQAEIVRTYVSDHRPVLVRFGLNQPQLSTGIKDVVASESLMLHNQDQREENRIHV